MSARRQVLLGISSGTLEPTLCFCTCCGPATPLFCLSESFLFISAQLRCHLLQEGVPDFSLSAHPCSLPLTPGLYLFTPLLAFNKHGYSCSSFVRLRDPHRRGPCPWTGVCECWSCWHLAL